MEFREHKWTTGCNGHKFEAIGYELRGFFWVPIVKFDETTNEAISCDVYKIISGFKTVRANEYIGGTRLNQTEIALLESVGCEWTGEWIKKK